MEAVSSIAQGLRQRVMDAAEQVLRREGSVGPLELLEQMGWLATAHLQGWRRGLEYYQFLEPHFQSNAARREHVFSSFTDWAQTRGLKAMEASYTRTGLRGAEPLQVTEQGDSAREKFFRTRYVSADLPERKEKALAKKLTKPADLVVFQTVSDTAKCRECGTDLARGVLLFMEKGSPLCLTCADLDHLEFLPSGDTALTRRARKHSSISTVVVRFSRARGRYERQGVLVTPAALAQAEEECLADAPERAERRRLDVKRRQHEDQHLIKEMAQAILQQFPGCPAKEARQIAEHAALRGSGRVGRSASGRALEPKAIELAVVAHIRHVHTEYDQHLMQGMEREVARDAIRSTLDQVRSQWSNGPA